MGDGTGISWTDATWNPVRGCSRVSEGCRNCYAERVAARFSGPGQPYEGLVKVRSAVSGLTYKDPGAAGSWTDPRWSGDVRMVPEHLADPLRWRRPRRVFVNSMSDLFHERLTNEQIAAVFGVMAAAPRHTFQILTKRAARMREWFRWLEDEDGWPTTPHAEVCGINAVNHGVDIDPSGLPKVWPLPNVWLGVSVENQAAAVDRIDPLRNTPAAVRFLSCEPLLGELLIDEHLRSCGQAPSLWRPPLDWVIAGCESGPGARPCDVTWLRSLRDQCGAASVPFFLKQAVKHDTTVAVYPSARAACVTHHIVAEGVGSKRKAGGVIELPYLDGVQHASFPAVG